MAPLMVGQNTVGRALPPKLGDTIDIVINRAHIDGTIDGGAKHSREGVINEADMLVNLHILQSIQPPWTVPSKAPEST